MTTPPTRRPEGLSVPSRRLGRSARMGGLAMGLAGRMARDGLVGLGRGQRPDRRALLLTPANLHRITNELARMRGAAMKVGQLVSMDAGTVLPPDLAQIMARLRDGADFMPPKQLKSVLTSAWGPDWLRRVEQFDVRPIAAASIGQVHKARLKDGRTVAVKVQYPGIARSIDSDVANVGSLVRLSGLVPRGLDLAPLLEEARRQLHAETDYAAEAAQMTRFADLLDSDPRFALPRPVPAFTTKTVLTMDFVAGRPIEALENAPQASRNRVVEALFDLLLREIFEFGLVQTDPNFANYRHDPETDRIALLDFGATRALAPWVAPAYGALIRAGLAGTRDDMITAARRLGLLDDTLRHDHRDRVIAMIETAFDDLRRHPVYDFSDQGLARTLQAEGMALAQEGLAPTPPAADVLFLQRKIGGLYLLAARLGARVALHDLLDRHLP
ncbi:AarF/ABC1/UbiB kinase family protein [Salibaculum sp.]|uniref:ABC1 kinase family protein n=1 Tax=Salibaculum sp. TaxID=2855480 RepID=UPI002B4837F9|nr:AarF/ABC1/UbiB kinase family protein [Salibaculum sp.]HKL70080.1 AarF/ABC1/UbiB kinase family protein [Salibaculum sp.]